MQKTNSISWPKTLHLGITVGLAFIAVWALIQLSQRPTEGFSQVLATVGKTRIYRLNLNAEGTEKLKKLEFEKYRLLKEKTDELVETTILAEEAASRQTTIQALLNNEIGSKSAPDEKAAHQIYVLSPQAHKMPYDQAIKEILDEMKTADYSNRKKALIKKLSAKYPVRYKIQAPLGYPSPLEASSSLRRFAPYIVPEGEADVVNQTVVGPPSIGPAKAPVVIEVFSDFMCPFSARFSETMQKIVKEYPKQVRIEYRHLPLSFHKGADLLSEASLCAQEQGKFWQYHDALYAKQGARSQEELVLLAETLKLDTKSFSACLSSKKYRKMVESDLLLAKQRGAQGTPSYFINGNFSAGAVPFESIKPIIDWCLKPEGAFPKQAAPAQRKAQEIDNKIYTFDEKELLRSPVQGPKNAPVTLVEFVDFNCPFCKKGAESIQTALGKFHGKVRLISKQNPLSFHPNAYTGALAALCANEQNKYWEFRNEVFGKSWGKQTAADLKVIAKGLRLDERKFNQCLDSKKLDASVKADLALATANNVTGTPTYFINGKRVGGAKPAEEFEKTIQNTLARPSQTTAPTVQTTTKLPASGSVPPSLKPAQKSSMNFAKKKK